MFKDQNKKKEKMVKPNFRETSCRWNDKTQGKSFIYDDNIQILVLLDCFQKSYKTFKHKFSTKKIDSIYSVTC